MTPSAFQLGMNLSLLLLDRLDLTSQQMRGFLSGNTFDREEKISFQWIEGNCFAAPDRVAILPSPTKSLALVVAAIPLMRPRVPRDSANARISVEDPLNLKREPKKISLYAARSVARPARLRCAVNSGSFLLTDSPVNPLEKITPVPT